MKFKIRYYIIAVLIWYFFLNISYVLALPAERKPVLADQPILIIVADKLESTEFFNSRLPGINRLLTEGALGLMNIRSGSGYSSDSGYLTLGSGVRSVNPCKSGITYQADEIFSGVKAKTFAGWSLGFDKDYKNGNLVVPEIRALLNQTNSKNISFKPGLLGSRLHSYGWKTVLIGNIDESTQPYRPGGLLIMDGSGVIDSGKIDNSIGEYDAGFPYNNCFSISRVMPELKARIGPKTVIVVEFGDFARLDRCYDEMLPEQYQRLKQAVWERFDQLIAEVLSEWTPRDLKLFVLSPSVNKEGVLAKNLLAPLVIRSGDFKPGLLTSGSTRWVGLVTNIDFLPTILKITHLPSDPAIVGKTIKTEPVRDWVNQLNQLRRKIIVSSQNQRSLLDWYLGIISVCWVGGLLGIYLKKKLPVNWLLTYVAAAPFALLLLPLLPPLIWQVCGFLLLTLLITIVLLQIKLLNHRFLVLSAFTWMGLVVDQITGWNLIRFSALGYSSAAGARYYGMGNEYLGTFLAVTLIMVYLLYTTTSLRWPTPILLGISIITMGWPQLGAEFGGFLSAIPGFGLYLVRVYNLRLNFRRFWLALLGCLGIITIVGWWDSLRKMESQTHIGMFFNLIFSKNLSQIWRIFMRKAGMNLKLIVNSPWTRIIILAILISLVFKVFSKRSFIHKNERHLWQAVLISGVAAFFLNDSGVITLATFLAFGFSFILLKTEENR